MGTNSTDAAANRAKDEGAKRNLSSISPFFIVKDLQVSISYYIEQGHHFSEFFTFRSRHVARWEA